MGIAVWMGLESQTKCIICQETYLKEDSKMVSSGLCICRSCWSKVIRYRTPSAFCGNKYLNSCISGYPYSGVLRDAFVQYKFLGQKKYSKVFSEILLEVARYFVREDDFDIIIPVPISRERMTERGYNQSGLIAGDVAKGLWIEYTEKALFRIKHTKRQSGLNAKERIRNVEGAFLADNWLVKGKKILLVDDIYTRGATVSECARELKEKGAVKVVGITIFRSEIKDEKEEYKFKGELNA